MTKAHAMNSAVESITLEATEIRLTLRRPFPADGRALAAASAVRIFDRYPAFDVVDLTWDEMHFQISRQHVERLLLPDGFAAIADRSRWQELINRLVLDASTDAPAS